VPKAGEESLHLDGIFSSNVRQDAILGLFVILASGPRKPTDDW
jgi:hypothetical protein